VKERGDGMGGIASICGIGLCCRLGEADDDEEEEEEEELSELGGCRGD